LSVIIFTREATKHNHRDHGKDNHNPNHYSSDDSCPKAVSSAFFATIGSNGSLIGADGRSCS
jgi:hypothetical protein